MTRTKAASIHLALSAMIAAAVCGIMLFVWFPGPLFTAMGGNTLVMILVGVDVVLGPLITLIIFNPRKARHLIRLDLAVIGLVQLAAMVYGVYVVSEVRPQYMVFTVDRFDLVSTVDLRPQDLAQAAPEYRSLQWGSPRTVAAKPPTEANRQLEVITSAAAGGRDVQHFPEFYVPYEQLASAAVAKSHPIERLKKAHPESSADIDATLARLGRTAAGTRYLPLKARARDYSVLIDAKTGAVVGFSEVNPW